MLTLRHVLLPTDRSAWAESVFAHAAFFAGRHGATLHVLNVTSAGGARPGALVETPPRGGGDFRARLHRAAAEAVGLDVVHAELWASSAEEGILDYVETHGVDLVVMATHGRTGFEHLVLGSVAEAVVRRAPCAVLTVRPTAPHAEVEVRRILAPVDLSPGSRRQVAHAKGLAALFRAELHLLHVLPMGVPIPHGDVYGRPEPPSAAEVAEAREALRRLHADADGPEGPEGPEGPVTLHVEPEERGLDWAFGGRSDATPPAAEILAKAEHLDADLLVMGSHGRTGFKRLFLGSVAEEIVRKAPCPVFVVKPSGPPPMEVPAEAAAPEPAAHAPS
jgi:nucleotide-binding universal stress UspA family protein